jgi:NADH-quinone oxidoreductase subunit D
MGAMSVMLYAFREREEILKIFERFAGQRMMTSYIRIGGLALEPPAGWRELVKHFLDMMPARIDEYEELLTNNRIWQGRLKGVGHLPAETLIAMSTTGPGLRAAGVAFDNRKAFPYSSYEEFEFNVPTRTESDCFARYLVRVQEMRESLKIVRQAMNKITDQGPIKSEAPGIVPPQREKMKTEMEALIYHFKIFTEGFSPPPGEAYVAVESPRGELGCFIASDGSPKPLRVHFRSPSFINLQALPQMVKGQLIADTVASIGTIDIVLGEVDR